MVIGMLLSGAASAQSSLGIQGVDVSLGFRQDEGGTIQGEVASRIDVAVTGVHGLQGDLAFFDTDEGLIGQLAAHLYMAPRDGQKYGLFASYSDIDGRSTLWGSVGVEGLLAFGEDAVLGGHLGLGASDTDGLDYIFAGLSYARALTPEIEIEGTLDLADFDEAAFRALSGEVGVTFRYSPEGKPWGLYASVTHSDLSGRDGAPGEVRIGAGFTMTFGALGGTNPRTRPFRSVDPVAPLVRRGLF